MISLQTNFSLQGRNKDALFVITQINTAQALTWIWVNNDNRSCSIECKLLDKQIPTEHRSNLKKLLLTLLTSSWIKKSWITASFCDLSLIAMLCRLTRVRKIHKATTHFKGIFSYQRSSTRMIIQLWITKKRSSKKSLWNPLSTNE